MGGCAGSPDMNTDQIAVKLKHLKHQIASKVSKLQASGVEQQKTLIAEYKKPKSYRAKEAESCIADQITKKMNMIEVFNVDKFHVEKISQYSHLLKDKKKAQQTLFPSFRVILYSQSILKDQDIDSLCRMIRKQFSEVKEANDNEIESDVMRHYKKNDLPSPSMTNDYVLKLCHDENLDLAEINSVGHNYKFG